MGRRENSVSKCLQKTVIVVFKSLAKTKAGTIASFFSEAAVQLLGVQSCPQGWALKIGSMVRSVKEGAPASEVFALPNCNC